MSSKIDSNVYALSIQLSLESALANTAIDNFSAKIVSLEQQVSSAAQQALSTIADLASTATEAITGLESILSSINVHVDTIGTNYVDANKELSKQLLTQTATSKLIDKDFETATKMAKLHTDASKELKEHLDVNTKFTKGLEEIIQLVTEKNEGHQLQNQLLENDINLSDRVEENLSGMVANGERLNNPLRGANLQLRDMWLLIREIDADTEKFVTSNYRAYGSQEALLQSTRNLAMSTGILYGEALKAYGILGNLKAPQDQLNKYAEIVAKTTRFTGVGTEVTANYANKLRMMGYTTKDVEDRMSRAGEAMKRYGLSTSDVTGLMNISIETMQRMNRLMGNNIENMKKFESGREALAGFAKSVGYGSEALNQFHNYLANDVAAMIILKSMTGTTEQGIDGMNLAILRSGIAMEKELSILEKQAEFNDGAAAAFKVIEQQKIDLYFGGSRAAYEASRAMGRYAIANNIAANNIADFNKVMMLQASAINDVWDPANQTLTRQLAILGSTLWTVIGTGVNMISNFIYPFVRGLNIFITIVGLGIAKLNELAGALFKLMNLSAPVVSFIKWIGGGIVTAAAGFLLFSGALTTVITTISGLLAGLTGFTFALPALTGMITAIFTSIATGITAVSAVIATALTTIGTAVRPMIVPLLALGATFVMISAGAYVFAQAIKIVSDSGDNALPIMAGLTIAIAAIGATIVGLGYLAIAAAPGLGVLSMAFLAISASSVLFAYAIRISSDGIVNLASALSASFIANMFMLGGAITALGIAGVVAMPGLAILSISMIGLSVAATVLAGAFSLIGVSITDIDISIITTLATEFLNAATSFSIAATTTMVAAGLLAASGVAIAAGIASLSVGAALMAPVAIILAAASYGLQFSAGVLLTASTIVSQAGSNIATGGSALLDGSNNLLESTNILLLVGPQIGVASSSLLASSAMLISASFTIYGVGYTTKLAGDTLLVGATTLMLASTMLADSATNIANFVNVISTFGVAIDTSGTILTSAVTIFADVGEMLSDSGNLLKSGSEALLDSSTSLVMAGLNISQSSDAILSGGTNLHDGVISIIAVSELLLLSGSSIISGFKVLDNIAISIQNSATNFNVIGDFVVLSSSTLVLVGTYLHAAGINIKLGATAISDGVTMLSDITTMIGSLAVKINDSGEMLLGGSNNMLVAVDALSIVGYNLISVAPNMIGGALAISAVASILLIGANYLDSASSLLYNSSVLIVNAGNNFYSGSANLNAASSLLFESVDKISRAGTMLVPASFAIYTGIKWLEFGINRFSGSVDNMIKISAAVSILTASFTALGNVPIGHINDLTDSALMATSNIDKLGNTLINAATKLESGVTAIEGPANRLIMVLGKLDALMREFGTNININANLAETTRLFEEYALILEKSAQRVEDAVNSKSLTALRATEPTNSSNAVRPQTISTVQVLNNEGGQARSEINPAVVVAQAQLEVLKAISEKVVTIAGNKPSDLADILELLRQVLPGLADNGGNLGSQLNNWG